MPRSKKPVVENNEPSPSSDCSSLHDPETTQAPHERTPVPKLQLLSVCVSRVAEPLAYSQIFPYINQMVWELGVTDNQKKVGFYSGTIDSAFAFAQLFTIYAYGTLSDRIGRKPVILLGTSGVMISAILFGLSRSFVHMLVTRTLAGLLSGYVAVLHSVLGELTDETNQAAAYPIYSLCYPIGSLVGPLIGGALTKPNENMPHLVPSFLRPFFDKYPYFLPSGAAAAVAAISFTFVLTIMKETLPSKARSKPSENSGTSTPSSSYGSRSKTRRVESSRGVSPSTTSTCVGEEHQAKPANEEDALLGSDDVSHKWTARELLKLPHIRQLCRSAIALSFLAESYIIVFVLFCYTRIENGGLNFDPSAIGFALATAGTIGFSLQLCILPYLLRRFKPESMYGVCMKTWPIVFAIPPLLNAIARASSENGAHEIGKQARAVIWIGIWIAQVLSKFGCMAYSMNMIIARNNAPDKRALGATNGLNQFSLCIARMFAPTSVSALFAFSSDHNLIGGHLVWIVMVLLALLGTRLKPTSM